MAEAILRAQVGDGLDIVSAGVAPAPLHPLTIAVLEEAGYSLHAHAPVSARSLLGRSSFSSVILIGGVAETQRPRMFLGAVEKTSWDLDDPSHAPETERLDAFRRCRDRIVELAKEWTVEQIAIHRVDIHLSNESPTLPLRIPKPKHH